jgi:hypothetical protein
MGRRRRAYRRRQALSRCRDLRELRHAVVDESQVGWQQPDRDDRQPACRLGTQLPLAISRGPSLRCAATKQPRLARPYLRPLGGHPFVQVERESKSVRGSRISRYCQGVSGRAERAASAEELPLLPSTLAPERASPDHDDSRAGAPPRAPINVLFRSAAAVAEFDLGNSRPVRSRT